jgi:hypothetical protein
MRTVVILIVLLIGMNIYAQNNTTLLQQNKIRKEIKGRQNTYIDSFCVKGNYRLVFNKNFNLWKKPSEWEKIEATFPNSSIDISNYKLLNDLVFRYIYANVDPKETEGQIGTGFFIHIFSNNKGKIKGVVIRCPTHINLPITAYEDFEKALLNSGLTLEFNTEYEIIKDSKWVRRWFLYEYNYNRYQK